MARPTKFLPGPDDPDPSRSWEVYASDNFDRDSPPSADVTGHGIIPGLMELWVRFLFETVKFSRRTYADGTSAKEAGRGFIDFSLYFNGAGREDIAGDFAGAGRIKHWMFGDGDRIERDKADAELLRLIAQAHARLRAKAAPQASAAILACAVDGRDAFVTRIAAL